MSRLINRLKAEILGLKQERLAMQRSNRDGSMTIFVEEIDDEIQRLTRMLEEHIEAEQVTI